jgi:hypothetical protein
MTHQIVKDPRGLSPNDDFSNLACGYPPVKAACLTAGKPWYTIVALRSSPWFWGFPRVDFWRDGTGGGGHLASIQAIS